MAITVDNDTFRTRFAEFASLTDDEIQGYYNQIDSLISKESNTNVLSEVLRTQGVYLATAVIAKEYGNLSVNGGSGDIIGGTLGSASEGSVSVGYQTVPYKTLAEWDLLAANLQPYGKMLLRILDLAQPEIQVDGSVSYDYYNSYRGN